MSSNYSIIHIVITHPTIFTIYYSIIINEEVAFITISIIIHYFNYFQCVVSNYYFNKFIKVN